MNQNKVNSTVLVLESSTNLSVLLNCTFQHGGFQAISCADMESVECFLDESAVDIVLIEEGQHDLEDISLMQHIQDYAPNIPIVFIAAHQVSYAALGATLLDIFAVLARPFRFSELNFVLLAAKAKYIQGLPNHQSDTKYSTLQEAITTVAFSQQ